MNTKGFYTSKHIIGGTTWIFLAEILIIPTGLITVAFLTRKLGPEGYGQFTLAITIVIWLELTITAAFSRSIEKLVSEVHDWRLIGASAVRLHLVIGVVTAVVLWGLSVPISMLLNEPVLASYLRLFAIDIPIFCLAQAHKSILVGMGRFHERALTSAGRWSSRVVLIVMFVELGLSLEGAIFGSIGASVVELVVGRFYIRPPLFKRTTVAVRQLWFYALPLFFYVISVRIFEKLDLYALKMLGGTAAQAGYYGAAQNLALLPGIFAMALVPPLLSSLSRILRDGEKERAQTTASNALRVMFWLLPIAGMIAGAGEEISEFVFGPNFHSSGPLLAVLIFGAVARSIIAVATSVMIANNRPDLPIKLFGPLIPLSIFCYTIVIPNYQAVGAAYVTTLSACATALIMVAAIYRMWHVKPSIATLLCCSLASVLAWALSAAWPTHDSYLLIKLCVICFLIGLGLFLFGEFSVSHFRSLWSVFSKESLAVSTAEDI